MARRPGRPMGPEHQRFERIPRIDGSCLYAALLSNGVVKVGFSRNPRTRMGSLCDQVRREFGAGLVSFHVGRTLPVRAASLIEPDLLRRLRAIGTPVEGRFEFFHHVHFGQAKTLVQQLSSRASEGQRVHAPIEFRSPETVQTTAYESINRLRTFS